MKKAVAFVVAAAFVWALAENPDMGTSIGQTAKGVMAGLGNFFKAF